MSRTPGCKAASAPYFFSVSLWIGGTASNGGNCRSSLSCAKNCWQLDFLIGFFPLTLEWLLSQTSSSKTMLV
jgi:hypothetical protein